MKSEYSFRNAKRGAVIKKHEAPPPEPGKARITIRIDEDVLERFYALADDTKTGYQTLINGALREYIDGKAPKFEETLRRIVREEIIAHSQT